LFIGIEIEDGEKLDKTIQTLTRMKNDTSVIIEKLEVVREYYKFYKSAAEAYDRAIIKALDEMNNKLGSVKK
jgi:hypothetical protein